MISYDTMRCDWVEIFAEKWRFFCRKMIVTVIIIRDCSYIIIVIFIILITTIIVTSIGIFKTPIIVF
jgi:hypothetical protein